MQVSPEEFDGLVQKALDSLPQEFRDRLTNLTIEVQPEPEGWILEEMGPDLMGLYLGTPWPERSVLDQPVLPDQIILYQKVIEEASETLEQLVDEVTITLFHEIGHALGLDEDEVLEFLEEPFYARRAASTDPFEELS